MDNLLKQLQQDYPQVIFAASDGFRWSPSNKTLFYDSSCIKSKKACYTLLHELGHALLNHTNYQADTELVRLEIEAWDKAKEIAPSYSVSIPQDHIEDCLDSYRDWLLARAKCPDCELAGVQSLKDLSYTCINCSKNWSVPTDQTCTVRRTAN